MMYFRPSRGIEGSRPSVLRCASSEGSGSFCAVHVSLICYVHDASNQFSRTAGCHTRHAQVAGLS